MYSPRYTTFAASPGRRIGTPEMNQLLTKDNQTLLQDNRSLLTENQRLQGVQSSATQWKEQQTQRSLVLEDELQSAHRSLAAARDEQGVLLREKMELNSANKVMLQRINKLENFSKGKEESVREINSILKELQKVKSELAADNTSLKRQLKEKEETLHNLESELTQAASLALDSPGGYPGARAGGSPHVGYQPLSPHSRLELKGDLQQRLRFLENVNQSLQNDNLSLNKSLDHLQRSITALRTAKLQDAEEIESLTKDMELQRRDMTATQKQLIEEREGRQHAESTLAVLRQEVLDLKAEIYAHSKGVRSTSPSPDAAKLSDIQQELQGCLHQLTGSRAELERKQRDYEALQASLADERELTAKLRATLETRGVEGSSAAEQWQKEAEFLSKELKETRTRYEDEISQLRSEMRQLQQQQPQAASEAAKWEGVVADLEAKLSAQSAIVSKRDDALAVEAEHCRELEAEVRHLKGLLEQKGTAARDTDSSHAALKRECQDLEDEVKRLRDLVKDRDECISHLRLAAQQKASSEDTLQHVKKELEGRREATERREKECEAQELRLRSWAHELGERQQSLDKLEEAQRKKEVELDQQRTDEVRLGAEVQSLKMEVEEARSYISSLEAVNKTLEAQLEGAAGKRESEGRAVELLEEEMQRLREQLREMAKEKGDLSAESVTLQRQMAFFKDQVEQLRQQHELDERQLARDQEDLAQLREQEQRLLKSLADARTTHQSVTPITAAEELSKMEAEVDGLRKQVGDLEDKVMLLQSERDAALVETQQYKSQLEDAKTELHDNVYGTLVAAEERIARSEKAKVEAEELAAEARRGMANAQAAQADLSSQLANVKARLESGGDQSPSDRSSGPRSSKSRAAKTQHKLQLFEAQVLVDSWKIEMARRLRPIVSLRKTNRALERQVMGYHDHPAKKAAPSFLKTIVSYMVFYSVQFLLYSAAFVLLLDFSPDTVATLQSAQAALLVVLAPVWAFASETGAAAMQMMGAMLDAGYKSKQWKSLWL